jgi:hypothetical protein
LRAWVRASYLFISIDLKGQAKGKGKDTHTHSPTHILPLANHILQSREQAFGNLVAPSSNADLAFQAVAEDFAAFVGREEDVEVVVGSSFDLGLADDWGWRRDVEPLAFFVGVGRGTGAGRLAGCDAGEEGA